VKARARADVAVGDIRCRLLSMQALIHAFPFHCLALAIVLATSTRAAAEVRLIAHQFAAPLSVRSC